MDDCDNLTEIKQEVGRASHRKKPGQIYDSISACDAAGTYCGLTPVRYLHKGVRVSATPLTNTHARTHARRPTHTHNECSRNWVLILVGAEIL